MQSLLLPDADVIIGLHELGYWDQVVKLAKIHVASSVIGEVKHYWKLEKQIPIDLSKMVADGKIIKLEGPPEKQSELLQQLRKYNLHTCLNAGELESITIIYCEVVPELKFCVRERPAMKVMACLDMREQAVSVEQVLRDCGILKRKENIPGIYSQIRFERIFLEGTFIQVESD